VLNVHFKKIKYFMHFLMLAIFSFLKMSSLSVDVRGKIFTWISMNAKKEKKKLC